jgi:hypothetical protein
LRADGSGNRPAALSLALRFLQELRHISEVGRFAAKSRSIPSGKPNAQAGELEAFGRECGPSVGISAKQPA